VNVFELFSLDFVLITETSFVYQLRNAKQVQAQPKQQA